eukprot:gene5043-34832_t
MQQSNANILTAVLQHLVGSSQPQHPPQGAGPGYGNGAGPDRFYDGDSGRMDRRDYPPSGQNLHPGRSAPYPDFHPQDMHPRGSHEGHLDPYMGGPGAPLYRDRGPEYPEPSDSRPFGPMKPANRSNGPMPVSHRPMGPMTSNHGPMGPMTRRVESRPAGPPPMKRQMHHQGAAPSPGLSNQAKKPRVEAVRYPPQVKELRELMIDIARPIIEQCKAEGVTKLVPEEHGYPLSRIKEDMRTHFNIEMDYRLMAGKDLGNKPKLSDILDFYAKDLITLFGHAKQGMLIMPILGKELPHSTSNRKLTVKLSDQGPYGDSMFSLARNKQLKFIAKYLKRKLISTRFSLLIEAMREVMKAPTPNNDFLKAEAVFREGCLVAACVHRAPHKKVIEAATGLANKYAFSLASLLEEVKANCPEYSSETSQEEFHKFLQSSSLIKQIKVMREEDPTNPFELHPCSSIPGLEVETKACVGKTEAEQTPVKEEEEAGDTTHCKESKEACTEEAMEEVEGEQEPKVSGDEVDEAGAGEGDEGKEGAAKEEEEMLREEGTVLHLLEDKLSGDDEVEEDDNLQEVAVDVKKEAAQEHEAQEEEMAIVPQLGSGDNLWLLSTLWQLVHTAVAPYHKKRVQACTSYKKKDEADAVSAGYEAAKLRLDFKVRYKHAMKLADIGFANLLEILAWEVFEPLVDVENAEHKGEKGSLFAKFDVVQHVRTVLEAMMVDQMDATEAEAEVSYFKRLLGYNFWSKYTYDFTPRDLGFPSLEKLLEPNADLYTYDFTPRDLGFPSLEKLLEANADLCLVQKDSTGKKSVVVPSPTMKLRRLVREMLLAPAGENGEDSSPEGSLTVQQVEEAYQGKYETAYTSSLPGAATLLEALGSMPDVCCVENGSRVASPKADAAESDLVTAIRATPVITAPKIPVPQFDPTQIPNAAANSGPKGAAPTTIASLKRNQPRDGLAQTSSAPAARSSLTIAGLREERARLQGPPGMNHAVGAPSLRKPHPVDPVMGLMMSDLLPGPRPMVKAGAQPRPVSSMPTPMQGGPHNRPGQPGGAVQQPTSPYSVQHQQLQPSQQPTRSQFSAYPHEANAGQQQLNNSQRQLGMQPQQQQQQQHRLHEPAPSALHQSNSHTASGHMQPIPQSQSQASGYTQPRVQPSYLEPSRMAGSVQGGAVPQGGYTSHGYPSTVSQSSQSASPHPHAAHQQTGAATSYPPAASTGNPQARQDEQWWAQPVQPALADNLKALMQGGAPSSYNRAPVGAAMTSAPPSQANMQQPGAPHVPRPTLRGYTLMSQPPATAPAGAPQYGVATQPHMAQPSQQYASTGALQTYPGSTQAYPGATQQPYPSTLHHQQLLQSAQPNPAAQPTQYGAPAAQVAPQAAYDMYAAVASANTGAGTGAAWQAYYHTLGSGQPSQAAPQQSQPTPQQPTQPTAKQAWPSYYPKHG